MPIRVFGVLLAALSLAATSAAADEGLWQRLREGGVGVLMRHATAPGTGDPASFTLGDCSTQRNLNEAGRAEARATGDAFRRNGVTDIAVLSSRWCRSSETAELMDLRPVEPHPPLDSFFAGRGDQAAQTAAMRQRIAGLSEGETEIYVTHQVNITALTDIFPRSGELIVVASDGRGGIEVLGRMGPFRR
ncbi:Phosphoglycerate mutase family protein [Lutibaculum baratangense AMV1]|uniref:Phosphoglycerate mutase family protein n=1 Tax=Lutibaculum baratangense AMV1 TaxID=631454 RepID=V4RJ90_9HYPH|nr:Phosphoglycerate mutase family protein [Lutibaculum baratangense AMV1]